MTARKCITGKAEDGKVNRDDAARVAQLFDDIEAQHRGSMGPGATDAAAADVTRALQRQIRERKRRTLRQLRAQNEVMNRADATPTRVDDAMLGLLDFDPTGRVSGENVSMMKDVIRGRAHALMADFLSTFRSKAAGFVRRKPGLEDIVSELHGQSTGNAEAKTMAGAITESFEYLRRTFNQAGGAIPKRKDWGMPQMHDRGKLARADKDKWINFTFDRLDRAKMIDLDTGLPMSDAKLRTTLQSVYDNIVSDGLIDIKGSGAARRSIIARRQEHRFLTFKDSKTWLEYQRLYGHADVFSIITGHVESMARDIATIQVLGPNPEATMRLMENLIDQASAKKAISGTGRAAAKVAADIAGPKVAIRDTYNSVTGMLGTPSLSWWANVSQGNRNILTSAMLGGAFFSALADRTFSSMASSVNGIPAGRVLKEHLKLFTPHATADQRQAVRLGFTAQGWSNQAIGLQRYIGEVIGPEWTRRFADSVLRLSLLSPWTQAGRWGFQTEMLGFITEQAGRKFKNLPSALQRSFRRHGVTPNDWELIRNTPLWKDPETGATFLRPQDMLAGFDDIQAETPLFRQHSEAANKLQQALFIEAEFAIPSSTARVRGLLTGGKQSGTFWGEMIRNVTLFKSFPVTLLHTHLQRGATLQGGTAKGKYFAHLIIGTAIMGALGEQLSQISKGRDPITMDPESEEGKAFWLKAMTRGGGFGIFGDFLFSDVNRYGGGILATAAGPVLGSQVPSASRLTVGNLQELFKEGEAKNPGRELIQFVKLMAPGRSLWYATNAMERLIFDEAQKLIDPNYAQSFQSVENRMRQTTGQEFFSRPGQGVIPQRAPRLEAAIGR